MLQCVSWVIIHLNFFPLKPDFKDKLSPIFFSMNYSVADSQDAVLHGQSVAFGQVKAGTYRFCCYNGTYLLTLTCWNLLLRLGTDNTKLWSW